MINILEGFVMFIISNRLNVKYGYAYRRLTKKDLEIPPTYFSLVPLHDIYTRGAYILKYITEYYSIV